MAGANASAMAAASARCRVLCWTAIRFVRRSAPLNVNFFCQTPPEPDSQRQEAWKARLRTAYEELELNPNAKAPSVNRAPFDAAICEVVEDLKPEVVSFYFGLPEKPFLDRVKAAGCKVVSLATMSAEAEWLAERGCDAIIAQGYEAGGHRGIFLNKEVFA